MCGIDKPTYQEICLFLAMKLQLPMREFGMTVFSFLVRNVPMDNRPNVWITQLFLYAANYDVDRMWENTDLQKRVRMARPMRIIALEYGKDPHAWLCKSVDLDPTECYDKGFLFKPKVLELMEGGLRAIVGYALYAQQRFCHTMESIRKDKGLTEQSWAWLQPNFYYKAVCVMNGRMYISTFFKRTDGFWPVNTGDPLGISVRNGSTMYHPIVYNEYL